ncbi:hypothetical protein FRB90_001911 [Tulasnella sp. 427]|nr:hypothetical protein FRB90_001911 [Tulasnella sp. 427]
MASTNHNSATISFPSGKPQPTPTHDAVYNLPTIENTSERGRLDFQHNALRIALGSLYAAPELVEKRIAKTVEEGNTPRVMDIGTGSGIWAESVARELPRAQVIGVDLAPVTPDSNTPPNCRFEYRDANESFTDITDKFDVVHIRAVAAGVSDQNRLIHEVARILKPGGVLLLAAGDMYLHTPDYERLPVVEEGQEGWCAMQAIFTQVREAMLKQGRSVNAMDEFQPTLEKSQLYTYLGTKNVYCPIGPWKEDTPEIKWKQVGELFALNAGRMIETLASLLVQSGKDKETVDRWLETVKEEIKTCTPKAQALFRHVWAVRTDAEWTPGAESA